MNFLRISLLTLTLALGFSCAHNSKCCASKKECALHKKSKKHKCDQKTCDINKKDCHSCHDKKKAKKS